MRTMTIALSATEGTPPSQVTDEFLHAILEHLRRECVSNGYSARLARTTTSDLKIVEIILNDDRKLCIGAKRGSRAGVINIASFEIVKGECCAATHALAALLEERIAEICQEYSEGAPGAPSATAAATTTAATATATTAATATATTAATATATTATTAATAAAEASAVSATGASTSAATSSAQT